MEDNFNLKQKQIPRLRALFCLENAATALRDLYISSDSEDEKLLHLRAAGELHAMAEQMRRRWKAT